MKKTKCKATYATHIMHLPTPYYNILRSPAPVQLATPAVTTTCASCDPNLRDPT